jgi:hypothetical protein
MTRSHSLHKVCETLDRKKQFCLGRSSRQDIVHYRIYETLDRKKSCVVWVEVHEKVSLLTTACPWFTKSLWVPQKCSKQKQEFEDGIIPDTI